MKKVVATFATGPLWDHTLQLIVERSPQMGADEVMVFDSNWFEQHEFFRLNHWLWDKPPAFEAGTSPRGNGYGYYCWKPLIVLEALRRCQDGDIVLFTDADCYPVRDFSVLYRECERNGGIMLFEASAWQNRQWCKRDCYAVMGQDEPQYHDSKAGCSRFGLFQRGPWRTEQFLMEWLTYSINPRATTFDPSILAPELPGFREHRNEQSILTLLAHRYGIKLYREMDQSGDGVQNDKALFPTLFCQEPPPDWDNRPIINGGTKFANIS